jgi:hypothetical protein
MVEALLLVAIGLVVIVALLATVFVLGMRTQSPLVLRPLIWVSRRYLNPRQMRTAGQPGAYASIIRVRGRRTGRIIDTPVGVVATDDRFLITTPYGTGAQWLRNVLVAGEALLVTEGRTYQVDRPEIVPMRDVARHFSRTDQRLSRLLAMNHCLRLRRVTTIADMDPGADEARAHEGEAAAAA